MTPPKPKSAPFELTPEVIRGWRERQGISVQDLAALLSVSKLTVERWEQTDPKDKVKPASKPTGTAKAILEDLIQAEDEKTQAERSRNAAAIAAIAGGSIAARAAIPGIAGIVGLATPLGGLGLAGYGLYRLLKKTWEPGAACPKCKHTISTNAKFCPECGHKLV